MREVRDLNPVRWIAGELALIDQTKLPTELTTIRYQTSEQVARAIETMVVRGAPAIGITAAFGVVLAAKDHQATTDALAIHQAIDRLRKTRPTAVNLFWALDRMQACLTKLVGTSGAERYERLLAEAQLILQEDIDMCRTMGNLGANFIQDGMGVLTHCNAGALATGGWGTALGVIRSAWAQEKNFEVFADETRPRLQGARLTAYELHYSQIPVTVITDSMAASLMKAGKIQLCIVGADRIAANGDVANKIGTYGVAVLAKHHGIPFIVAAPSSTIDAATSDGTKIPIEHRSPIEVSQIGNDDLVPRGVRVINPAFDVTPAALVSAIVTEKGVFRGPYKFGA